MWAGRVIIYGLCEINGAMVSSELYRGARKWRAEYQRNIAIVYLAWVSLSQRLGERTPGRSIRYYTAAAPPDLPRLTRL